jgi:hypothetical protein
VKTTFTEEAIEQLPAETLGEIIKSRVRQGIRTLEVVTLDEALGRLSAIGEIVDQETSPAPIEVEPRYSAPTNEEAAELVARIRAGSRAEAPGIVAEWIETRYGVVSSTLARAALERGEIRVDSSVLMEEADG